MALTAVDALLNHQFDHTCDGAKPRIATHPTSLIQARPFNLPKHLRDMNGQSPTLGTSTVWGVENIVLLHVFL